MSRIYAKPCYNVVAPGKHILSVVRRSEGEEATAIHLQIPGIIVHRREKD